MKIPAWVPEGTEVDEKTYGKDLDMTDVSQITAAQATGHLINFFNNCKEEQWRDKKLWIELREDFDGWNVKLWELVDKNIRARFRDHIRDDGVYVKRDGKSVSKHLQAVLDEEKYHEWTSAEVEEQLEHGQFYSKWNPAPSALVTAYTQPLPGGFPNAFGGYAPTSALFGAYAPWVPQSTNLPPPAQQYAAQQYGAPPPPPPLQLPTGGAAQSINQTARPSDSNLTKMLTDLSKFYHDDEKKYSGDAYDILKTKLQIFYDCCSKAGIPPELYHKGFSIMLKGQASKFYYAKLTALTDFSTMLNLTGQHFETEEKRQMYLQEWREATLERMTKKNPDKNMMECLEMLFKKLEQIQPGLSMEYNLEWSLRDQVINACRGVKACDMCLFKPSQSYESVCADLRSSVGTFMRSTEASGQYNIDHIGQYNTSNEFDDEYGQHWTDRTYGGRGRGRGRSFGPYRGRGGSTNRGSKRYGGTQRTGFQQKRCHVCDKPGCWSTKHTAEERKKAYEKFRQYASYIL